MNFKLFIMSGFFLGIIFNAHSQEGQAELAKGKYTDCFKRLIFTNKENCLLKKFFKNSDMTNVSSSMITSEINFIVKEGVPLPQILTAASSKISRKYGPKRQNYLKMIDLLLDRKEFEQNPQWMNQMDSMWKSTPLMFLAQQGEKELVEKMIKLKVDVHLSKGHSYAGLPEGTALSYAALGLGYARLGYLNYKDKMARIVETIKLLVENGADPNTVDIVFHSTLLMFVAQSNNLELVQLLLDHGARNVICGKTAAGFSTSKEIVELLEDIPLERID